MDNKGASEVKHLTSLSFDIDKAREQLNILKKDVEDAAKEIATEEKYKFKLDFERTSQGTENLDGTTDGTGTGTGVTSSAVDQTEKLTGAVTGLKTELLETAEAGKRLSAVSVQFVDGEQIKRQEKYVDDLGQSIVETDKKLKDGSISSSTTITNNYDSVRNSLERAKNSFADLANTMTSSNSQVVLTSETYEDVYRVLGDIIALEQKAEKTRSFSQEEVETINNFNTALKLYKNELVELRSEQTKLDNAMEKMDNAYKEIGNSIESLVFKYGQLNRSITETGKVDYFADISPEIEKNLNALSAVTDKINQQGTPYTEDTAKVDQLTEALDRLHSEFNRLNTARKEEEKQAEALRREYAKNVESLDSLITKYSRLEDKMRDSGELDVSSTQLNKTKDTLQELITLREKVYAQKTFSQADLDRIKQLEKELNELNYQFQRSKTASDGFLKVITDKARWLAAFYLVDTLRTGFMAVIDTIRETEDAVVSIQRVITEDLAQSEISEALYKLAEDYGRVFSDVSETAVKFAQTGASWGEVLSLTESTMLAVNTAELEVETATTGLIAVIAQFNLEATDMQIIIDKINKTADNFPVTSEKIVEALQRAGGAAASANISLDETIAIITSLSEATGRAGTSIGTAINALIAFSQRASSLDTFASLGGDVEEVVEKYRMGAASITDLWQALATSTAAQQSKLQETLLASAEYTEFAEALESEASDLTEQIRGTYETAGTHRQNYFIALLSGMETYESALLGMASAEGYSLEENAKYMDTITAQMNELKTVAMELAVSFGDSGFTDFLKWSLQTATSVIKLTDAYGGLNTVLAITIGLVVAQKWDDVITMWRKLTTQIGVTTAAMRGATSVTAALSAGLKTLGTSTIVGAVVTGVTLAATALFNFNKQQEEAVRLAKEASSGLSTEAEQLEQLKLQYEGIINSTKSLAEKNEELAAFKVALVEQYGFEQAAINDVNEGLVEMVDLLEQAKLQRYGEFMAEFGHEVSKATDIIENSSHTIDEYGTILGDAFDATKFRVDLSASSEEIERLKENFGDLIDISSERSKLGGFISLTAETDNLLEQLDIYNELIGRLSARNDLSRTEQILLDDLIEKQKDLNDYIGEYGDLYNQAINNEVLIQSTQYIERIQAAIKELGDEEAEPIFDSVIEEIRQTEFAYKGVNDLLVEGIQQLFPQYGEAFKNAITPPEELINRTLEEIEADIQTYTDSLNGTISTLQSLKSATGEFNDISTQSASAILELASVSGEYAAILDVTEDGLVINTERAADLLQAKKDLLIETIREQEATQLANLASYYLEKQLEATKTSTANLKEEVSNLRVELPKLSLTMGENARSAMFVAQTFNAVNAAAQGLEYPELEGEWLAGYERDAQKIKDITNELINSVNNRGDDIDFWTGADSSSASYGINAYADAQSVLNTKIQDNISILNREKEAIQEGTDALNDRISGIKEYSDELLATTEEYYEVERTRIESLYALERDKIQSIYDTEIEGLQAVEAENDRIRAKEEYEERLATAKASLAEVQARSGVEYREQEADLEKEIEDINKDWQQQLEDWELEDRLAKLEAEHERELALLEEREQAEIESLTAKEEAEIEKIESIRDAEIAAIQAVVTQRDAEVSALNKTIEGLQNILDLISSIDTSNMGEQEQQLLQGLLGTYNKDLEEYTADTYSSLNKELENLALPSAQTLEKIYSENFTLPMQEDFSHLFGQVTTDAFSNASTAMLEAGTQNLLSPMSDMLSIIFGSALVNTAEVTAGLMFTAFDNNLLSRLREQVADTLAQLNSAQNISIPSLFSGVPQNTNTQNYNNTSNNTVINYSKSGYNSNNNNGGISDIFTML